MSARESRRASAAARPNGGAPRPLWVAAFCVGGLCACDEPARMAALPSLEIERLAFVPPARVVLTSALEVGSESALLVGQFEVTRGEWRAWYLARAEAGDLDARARVEDWDPATDSWPASFLSLSEARAYARERGYRLPTSWEWLRIACGSAAAPYPWGPNDAASVANTLELGLHRPTPVGTFEQGRAPLEIYDLLGNVWEWVDDPAVRREPYGWALHEPFAWAMGGSYLTLRQPLFDARVHVTLHLALDGDGRSNEVGLRMVAEARTWLEAHAPAFSGAPAAQARLAAVGRRWGPSAVPLLEELAAAHPEERAFAWLLAGARP